MSDSEQLTLQITGRRVFARIQRATLLPLRLNLLLCGESGDAMNLHLFFQVASPTTLASLVADIQAMGTGASEMELKLERRAFEVLKANVGNDEANQLVDQMMNPVSA